MRKIASFLALVVGITAQAQVTDTEIANMFMLGFEGKQLSSSSGIMSDICDRGLGGVILFKKNIGTSAQLKRLTAQLSSCRNKPLISTDQEGGTVRRIRYGQEYPRASQVAKMDTKAAYKLYHRMGAELKKYGINYNLAPVADLDVQPKNYIIHKLGRSYGSNPKTVRSFDTAFIKAMHANNILTALKHYPGHGSSLGDTHRGFVDVSKTWSPAELEPFLSRAADSIMVAHVVNSRITEPGVPASLSPKAIGKLRKYNHNVVVITDDLQMGAIRKYYSTAHTLQRAINAGDDILLLGNQLTSKHKVSTKQLIKIVRSLLTSGKISALSIKNANRRINRMRGKIGLSKSRSRKTHPTPKKHISSPKRKSKAGQDLY
jgi:beta-N-acetylhexosaminidase